MTPEQKRRKLLLMQMQGQASQAPAPDPQQAMLDRVASAKAGTLQPSQDTLQRVDRANSLADPSAPPVDVGQIQSQIDTHNSRVATGAALLNKAGESMTMGLVGDEAAAGFDSLIGRGSYDDRLEFYRDQEAQLDNEHPALATGAAIGGALLGPGKIVKGVKKAATMAAGSSAVEGFLDGEGGIENRAIEAGKSAATGFIAGGLMSSLAKGASAGTKRLFSKAEERPSIELLGAAKTSAYKDVRRAGVKFSGDEMAGMSRRLQRLSKTARWDVDSELDEGAVRAMRAFERRAGKDITLNNLDKTRQRLWDVYKKSDEPFVLEAISEIDALIAKKADGNELMQTARAANSKYAKAQLLENAFKKARLQTASTGSGGNILNKYRQAVTRIVTNPSEARWFTEDELGLMESFIEGNVAENTLRRIGKIAPGGNGLMTALNLYAVSRNPAMVGATIVGSAAKAGADRSAMQGSERLLDAVATGAVKQKQIGAPATQLSVGAGTGANELRR